MQMAEDRINKLIAGAQGRLEHFPHVNEEELGGRKRQPQHQHQDQPRRQAPQREPEVCQTEMTSNVVTNPDNTKKLVST